MMIRMTQGSACPGNPVLVCDRNTNGIAITKYYYEYEAMVKGCATMLEEE